MKNGVFTAAGISFDETAVNARLDYESCGDGDAFEVYGLVDSENTFALPTFDNAASLNAFDFSNYRYATSMMVVNLIPLSAPRGSSGPIPKSSVIFSIGGMMSEESSETISELIEQTKEMIETSVEFPGIKMIAFAADNAKSNATYFHFFLTQRNIAASQKCSASNSLPGFRKSKLGWKRGLSTGVNDVDHFNRNFRSQYLNARFLIIIFGRCIYTYVLFDIFKASKPVGMKAKNLNQRYAQDNEAARLFITPLFVNLVKQHEDGSALHFTLKMLQDLIAPALVVKMGICNAVFLLHRGLYKFIYALGYFKIAGHGYQYNAHDRKHPNFFTKQTCTALIQYAVGCLSYLHRMRSEHPDEAPLVSQINSYHTGIFNH
jgi:hypothetical protein